MRELDSDGWAALLRWMEGHLVPEGSGDEWLRCMAGQRIQLSDHSLGHHVEFLVLHHQVQIRIDAPPSYADRRKLELSIERSDGDWEPCAQFPHDVSEDPYGYLDPPRQWQTSLYPSYSQSNRQQVFESVVCVMRDGLGMSLDNLRSRVWSHDGPGDADRWGPLTIASPDRPTLRGAPEQCTEWGDFASRLEWALTTMPRNSALILAAPTRTHAASFIQFACDKDAATEIVLHDTGDLDVEECDRRMSSLGWSRDVARLPEIDAPLWIDEDENTELRPTREVLAARTAATFRDVLSVSNPQQLRFNAFRHASDDDCGHLDAELGIPREEQ